MTYKQELRLLKRVEKDKDLYESIICKDIITFKFIDGKNSAKIIISKSSVYNALFIMLDLHDERGVSRVKIAGYDKAIHPFNDFYCSLRNLINNLENLETSPITNKRKETKI